MRHPLLAAGLALLLCVAAGAVDLLTAIEDASRLPPRQACAALSRLEAQVGAASPVVRQRFTERYQAALTAFVQGRQVSLAAGVSARREARLEMPPATSPRVALRVPLNVLATLSPDAELEVVRDVRGVSLDLRLRGGDRIRRLGSVPSDVAARHQNRLRAWVKDGTVEYGTPAWSPDGAVVAFTVQGVMCRQALDGPVVAVSSIPDAADNAPTAEVVPWDGRPIWAPDGRSLLLTRWLRDRQGRHSSPRAVCMDLAGRESVLHQGQAVGFGPVRPGAGTTAGPGDTGSALVLDGDVLYQVDMRTLQPRQLASGARAAALSPDGRTLAVVHVGRLGILDLATGTERTRALPAEPGAADQDNQMLQPPHWVSAAQVALTVVAPAGNHQHRSTGVWLLDLRGDRLTRLADGFLLIWDHTPRRIATSSGILELEY